MARQYRIVFWNVENLFDEEHYPHRTDKLQRAIGADLKGWTADLLAAKIAQLASVLRRINAPQGPDLIGLCEIENKHVMELLIEALALPDRDYGIVHHDTDDQRGIDVGFIYDKAMLEVQNVFDYIVVRRTATRDILQVNFQTKPQGRLFAIVGNHWPSRIPSTLETAGYRAIAGETLAYFHQRIWEVHGRDTPVLAMGDFNDDPSDRSLVGYALSTRSRTRVVNARSPRFYNLMWSALSRVEASFYYGSDDFCFDQFLADKNLLKQSSPIKILPETVQVVRFDGMFETGDYPRPIRFGGMGKTVNPAGYSDHFPIAVTVEEQG